MSVKIKTQSATTSQVIDTDQIEFIGAKVSRIGRKVRIRIKAPVIRIRNTTADPTAPMDGDIWLRTDL